MTRYRKLLTVLGFILVFACGIGTGVLIFAPTVVGLRNACTADQVVHGAGLKPTPAPTATFTVDTTPATPASR